MFTAIAKNNEECLTIACRQSGGECAVSHNEQVEASNIKAVNFGYIPCGMRLPKAFSLPFVSESAREGLFFTTIMKGPLKRLQSSVKINSKKVDFWADIHAKRDSLCAPENLSARWLSGNKGDRSISDEDLALAKCRLDLFNLVIMDDALQQVFTQIICPMKGWKKCDPSLFKSGKARPSDEHPLGPDVDRAFWGALIERMRPSFELCDYARQKSISQLRHYGLDEEANELAEKAKVPSMVETMQRYVNISTDGPNSGFMFTLPKEWHINLVCVCLLLDYDLKLIG